MTEPPGLRAPSARPAIEVAGGPVIHHAARPGGLPAVVWASATAALGALLVWTRLTGLSRSLWWDEAYTAHRYVRLGAEAILDPGAYSANNHVLYSLLSSWTVGWVGADETVLRLWAVVPGLLGTALLVWLLWHRLGAPVAVLALALITASPLSAALHTEARGYGIVLATATVLLAVTVSQNDRPTWAGDLLVAGAGTAAMLTFAPAVTVYVAHAGAWLVLRRAHRARLVALTACAGAVTAALLGRLLPEMLAGADRVGSRHAEPLSWWSPLVAGLKQQVGSGLEPALPGPAVLVTGIAVAGGLVGAAVLLARDRVFGIHIVVALMGSVGLLAAVGFHPIDRYLAFLMPHAVSAVAVGGATTCRALGRSPGTGSAVAVGAVCGLLLVRGLPVVQASTSVPLQDFAAVAEAVEAEDPATVVMRRMHVGYAWYLGRDRVTLVDGPEEVEQAWCDGPRPAVYVPDPDREPPGPAPSCLADAEVIGFDQRRPPGRIVYWVLRE